MTDDQIELRLRRALLDEGAEFGHSIDHGAIRTQAGGTDGPPAAIATRPLARCRGRGPRRSR